MAGLRHRIDRLLRSSAQLEADDLQARARRLDVEPIDGVTPGEVVTISGTLRTVTLRPQTGVAALEAEIYDGTGVVVLVWLGRRVIRGITPGRTLVVSGRVTRRSDRPTIFNPTYEILPVGS